jgi:hypothetical protein
MIGISRASRNDSSGEGDPPWFHATSNAAAREGGQVAGHARRD